MEAGRGFDIHPTGMLALDVARIEAGLILADVDYISSKKALIASQKYTPAEVGLGKLVHYEKENFIGRQALLEEKQTGPRRLLMGLEIDWNEVESLFDRMGLAPQTPATASRVHVPVYKGRDQVGKATSTTWSPLLKQADCAGQSGTSACNAGHHAADGNDRGSGTAQGVSHRPFSAVLQSTAQNQNADLAATKNSNWLSTRRNRRTGTDREQSDRKASDCRQQRWPWP